MDGILEAAGGAPALGGGLVLVGAVALAVFVVVMAINYRRFRTEPVVLNLVPDEDEIDRLEVRRPLSLHRMVLTDRRVLIQHVHWLFSIRLQQVIALEDVYSIRWRVGVNVLAIVVGALLLLVVRPLGLLLVMFGVESTTCAAAFVITQSKMPFSWYGVRARGREYLPQFARFHQRAQLAWARFRKTPDGTPRVTERPPQPLPVAQGLGFQWSRRVWASVLVAMGAALLQRAATGHVSFDDVVFAPVYLALPVAAARWSLGDGVWVAALGFMAGWSVKFPGILAESGSAHLAEAAAVLGTLLVMAVAAGLLARHVSTGMSFLALLLWPLCVGFTQGLDAVLDLRLAAIVLAAMAAAIVLSWADARLGVMDHAPA